MTVHVEASAFAAALKTVCAALPRGSGSMPTLNGVRVTRYGDGLHLVATSLDLTVETTVPASGDHLDIVIPGAVARDLAAKLDGTVTIDIDGDDIVLADQSGTARLRTLSVADWPNVRSAEGAPVKLSATHLVLLGRILHAASRDNNRPTLTGVYFNGGEVAATDSYRLAVVEFDVDIPEAVIPARVITLLLAHATDGAELVVDERSFTFTVGATSWTVRPIAGDYPKYRTLIPAGEPPVRLTVDREAMAGALARAIVLSESDDTHAVWITPIEQRIELSTSRHGVGESTVRLDAEWSGDRFDIGYNSGYLADMLGAVTGETVTFELRDAMKPVVVRDGGLTGLLMPTRR